MSYIKEDIQKKFPVGKILFELYTDNCEIFCVGSDTESDMFNEFVLIWGDYVANVWEEKFDNLSEATARMAQLIYVGEREAQEGETVMFKNDGDEFVSAWKQFNKETTAVA